LADAFARIVNEARERDADALTIGGDLYESERAGPQTARFLFEQFARFERPVLIAPGNHDPHAPRSLLARDDLPANVVVFNEAAWRPYPLADGITLFGFGHTPAEPGRPFVHARFERGGVQLALVHGSDEQRCPPHKRSTAPFTKSEVLAAGADLLLTGHYHGGYVSSECGKPVVAYPGSPEPLRFGEGATHGALVVTIDGTQIAVTPLPTAKTRLIEASCDLAGVTHENSAFERIEAALEPYSRDDYVRLRLVGSVATGTRVDPALMEERFGPALGSLSIEDTTAAHDYEAIAAEPTVRGHVVRDLLSAIHDADPAAAHCSEAALRYALAAFEAAEIAP
jgi:DNA repair exonuclease SbcCD nuclease subunit